MPQTLTIPEASTGNCSIDMALPALSSATTPMSDTSSEPDFPEPSQLRSPIGSGPAFLEVGLVQKAEPEIGMLSSPFEGDSSLSKFDWSGRGAHLQYNRGSEVPLELMEMWGMGGSSSVHRVRTKHQGSHIFAQKSLQVREMKKKQALYNSTACLINALRYLHETSIKHKDVKPSNILVQEWPQHMDGYHVYISDFGISTQIGRDNTRSTTIGPTYYTPRYASPETLTSESPNSSSDIFSMGCVWVEMYTVIIGERLSSLAEHLEVTSEVLDDNSEDRSSEASGGDKSEKERLTSYWGSTYAGSLDGTVRWLHHLKHWLYVHESFMDGGSGNFSGLSASPE
ncbi:hypothetical protein K458DRAFT_434259 [Lentithecium fluviatile CBS 122367]|uniref:Protein kinase domain-containing protein n=1 Tax=Lentithecium fluviatile CBS 122367 TaxID=1168545 RepID=A0A6G1IRV8_9PLEO|nr:hypothetical protein K458DRAFT_434259 [Lentithecium fluviatile CBS 122367]